MALDEPACEQEQQQQQQEAAVAAACKKSLPKGLPVKVVKPVLSPGTLKQKKAFKIFVWFLGVLLNGMSYFMIFMNDFGL